MKYRLLIAWLLTFLLALPAAAQDGLQVGALFGGKFGRQADAVETLLKGRKIAPYKLSLFRSLSVSANSRNQATIEQKVRADARLAVDKQAGMKSGHLYYGFYRLRPHGQTQRYIFYRNNSLQPRAKSGAKITLIYMEGTATIEELKRTFGQ